MGLKIVGHLETPLELTYSDFQDFREQIEDVSSVVPGKPGSGVRLEEALQKAGLKPGAKAVHLESADGSFSAELPLEVALRGVLVYRLGADPLPEGKGGPVRLLTPHDGACDPKVNHACANVKGLAKIEVRG